MIDKLITMQQASNIKRDHIRGKKYTYILCSIPKYSYCIICKVMKISYTYLVGFSDDIDRM